MKKAISEPPEAALTGDTVPIENQREQITQQKIEEVMNTLRSRGRPFINMSSEELREKAVEKIRKYDYGEEVRI